MTTKPSSDRRSTKYGGQLLQMKMTRVLFPITADSLLSDSPPPHQKLRAESAEEQASLLPYVVVEVLWTYSLPEEQIVTI